MLHLHEEILLLALDGDKGTIPMSAGMWQNAAGGALVAELLLAGRVRATDEKKPRLEVVDPTPLGDPVLDAALAEMAGREKLRKGADWVQKFGSQGKLKQQIADNLVTRGVLRREEGKVLWVFNTTHYPERDGRHEREVVRRMERAIFIDGGDIEPRTLVLVSLCKAADLLGLHFDKKRLKNRKDHLKKLCDGELSGSLAKEAVEAAQAAIMVATIMPALVSTTVITTSAS